MQIEAAALGHRDQGPAASTRERRAVPDAHDHPIDDALDDRLDAAGDVLERAPRQPAAAWLVPRKARPVDEQNTRARPCEMQRRRRSRRPGTDDEDIETLHVAIVGRDRGRGYNHPPRRDSRVAKGGGL